MIKLVANWPTFDSWKQIFIIACEPERNFSRTSHWDGLWLRSVKCLKALRGPINKRHRMCHFTYGALLNFQGQAICGIFLRPFSFLFFPLLLYQYSFQVLCWKYKLKSLELLSSREFKLERWKILKKKKAEREKKREEALFQVFFSSLHVKTFILFLPFIFLPSFQLIADCFCYLDMSNHAAWLWQDFCLCLSYLI